MRRYSASSLTERVTIQKPASSPGAYGEPSVAWSDVATVWAAVRSETGTERLRAGRVEMRQAHLVGIRYRDGIDGSCRLQWRGRTLHIQGVESDRVWIEMLCVEVV